MKNINDPVKQYTHDLQQLKQNVFYDLNEKGFFVGPADIYGADYSVYVGDPSKGHSVGTVRLVPPTIEYSEDEYGNPGAKIFKKHTVKARDILSYSRVQNHVAKMAIYAFDDGQLGDNTPGNGNKEDENGGNKNIQGKNLKYLTVNFHRVGVRI